MLQPVGIRDRTRPASDGVKHEAALVEVTGLCFTAEGVDDGGFEAVLLGVAECPVVASAVMGGKSV